MTPLSTLEARRLTAQKHFDEQKTKLERNRMGQFATPPALACDILTYAHTLLPNQQIRFLEPAIGTGAFYAALMGSFYGYVEHALGFEIDPQLFETTSDLWRGSSLEIEQMDFTAAIPPSNGHFNLLVSNPPYVRHHHLTKTTKARLVNLVKERLGYKMSALAGLHAYFLLLSHEWLAKDGIAGWLIPGEFMSVNYGREMRRYLTEQVTLLHIHQFSDEERQFSDALVSSAIVWYKKAPPPPNHKVRFSKRGKLSDPKKQIVKSVEELRSLDKWTWHLGGVVRKITHSTIRLSDLFVIKRGLATGNNSFFILSEESVRRLDLPTQFLRPILPSSRYLETNVVTAGKDGFPILEKPLYHLVCDLSEEEIRRNYPSLWRYLEVGKARGIHERYLCRNRTLWYSQEKREAALFLCTYMGRKTAHKGNPFRFILNESNAVAANSYLMLYPRSEIREALKDANIRRSVLESLNVVRPNILTDEGRRYGGGLFKLEPRELAQVPLPNIENLIATRPI